jgi:hypothetical protein
MPDGIMQQMTLEAKVKDDSMQDAFKDLEVLMVRAGEMVGRTNETSPGSSMSRTMGRLLTLDDRSDWHNHSLPSYLQHLKTPRKKHYSERPSFN